MSERGLTLEHQHYSRGELLDRCRDQLLDPVTSEWQASLYRFLQDWLSPSPELEINTSGATGPVKTIRVSKAAMRHSARLTGDFFQLSPGQNALLCLPLSHIAGQMMVVRAWELGLNLIWREPRGLDLASLPRLGLAALAPGQLYRLLFETDAAMAQLANIENLLLGGGVLSPALRAMLPPLPCRVYQSFGMTETLSHIALRRLHPEPQAEYQVLPGIEISTDQRGCLVIDGPALGVERLITHDVVALSGPGQFEWLGRFDNLINSGGYKWHPEQMEARLAAYAAELLGDRAFFFGALPDAKLGQRVVLVIEGEDDLSRAQLTALLDGIFPRYQRPKAIYYVPSLARTPTNKIRRQVILEQLLA